MKKLFFALLIFMTASNMTLAQPSPDQLIEDLLTTWDKHVAMNKLLLDGINEAYLTDKSASGGRNVGEQFAHMHNVRMMWLSQLAADRAKSIDEEIDAAESLKKDYVSGTLTDSDQLIRAVLKDALTKGAELGEMSPTRFMGYLISHESHTRGQIVLAMKQSDHALPARIAFGIWQW
jgi:uncharacterized damage-inducible protein DinB